MSYRYTYKKSKDKTLNEKCQMSKCWKWQNVESDKTLKVTKCWKWQICTNTTLHYPSFFTCCTQPSTRRMRYHICCLTYPKIMLFLGEQYTLAAVESTPQYKFLSFLTFCYFRRFVIWRFVFWPFVIWRFVVRRFVYGYHTVLHK